MIDFDDNDVTPFVVHDDDDDDDNDDNKYVDEQCRNAAK
jgi:hypothetical protein